MFIFTILPPLHSFRAWNPKMWQLRIFCQNEYAPSGPSLTGAPTRVRMPSIDLLNEEFRPRNSARLCSI